MSRGGRWSDIWSGDAFLKRAGLGRRSVWTSIGLKEKSPIPKNRVGVLKEDGRERTKHRPWEKRKNQKRKKGGTQEKKSWVGARKNEFNFSYNNGGGGEKENKKQKRVGLVREEEIHEKQNVVAEREEKHRGDCSIAPWTQGKIKEK